MHIMGFKGTVGVENIYEKQGVYEKQYADVLYSHNVHFWAFQKDFLREPKIECW